MPNINGIERGIFFLIRHFFTSYLIVYQCPFREVVNKLAFRAGIGVSIPCMDNLIFKKCFRLWLGIVHKLCWQDFGFFWPTTPSVDILYLINVDKKLTFLDHLPPSSCKRSLLMAP